MQMLWLSLKVVDFLYYEVEVSRPDLFTQTKTIMSLFLNLPQCSTDCDTLAILTRGMLEWASETKQFCRLYIS